MIPKEVKSALCVVAVIALVCVACVIAYEYVKESPQEKYSITYNLDGGTNASSNPNCYYVDDAVFFSTPLRDGYIFDGWYKDAAMKQKITNTGGLAEDLTLYAKWHQKRVFTITYELNGGVNSELNPATYLEDSSVMFDQPYKTVNVFKGWHLKSDFSDEKIDCISRYTNSDITLYAEWESDKSGYSYTYANSGTYKLPTDWAPMDITGNTYYTYLNYVYERGYHLKCKEVNTVTSDSTTAYWTNEHDGTDWTYKGLHTLTYKGEEKICKVYTATIDGESWTRYIGTDGVIYMMERYSESSVDLGDIIINMTYTLTDDSYAPMQDKYTITIYDDDGVTSTGSGTYSSMSPVELTATCDKDVVFGGWYTQDRQLASSSEVMKIEMLMEDIVLYAQNNREYDELVDGTITLSTTEHYDECLWTVYDSDGIYTYIDDEQTHRFNSAGNYVITFIGVKGEQSPVYKMYTVQSNGIVNKTYTWMYNGIQWNMDLGIDYAHYQYYKNVDTERSRAYTIKYGQLIFDDEHTAEFAEVDSYGYIEKIAEWFHTKKNLNGWTDLQTANCMLAFVQSIPYVSDLVSKGTGEYWRFPVETLYDGCADDEDKSFLYCAIAKALEYQTAILMFSGHVAASIYVYDAPGTPFTCQVKTKVYSFYYCETTLAGWTVGDVPEGYTQNGQYYNETAYGTRIGAVVAVYLK